MLAQNQMTWPFFWETKVEEILKHLKLTDAVATGEDLDMFICLWCSPLLLLVATQKRHFLRLFRGNNDSSTDLFEGNPTELSHRFDVSSLRGDQNPNRLFVNDKA